MSYLELLKATLPEVVLAVAALVVLATDLGVVRNEERRFRSWVLMTIAGLGCVLSTVFLLVPHDAMSLQEGMLVSDPLTRWVKVGIVALTLFTVLISGRAEFTEHVGEYFALILMATVGMLLLVSSEQLLMIFLSLELTSLSLYILTAFNKRNIRSAEAALKYFLFGGTAAAFTLFGLSLLYGISGETHLPKIAAALTGKGFDPLLAVAIVMTVIGFGFKVAAVPFHLWAPDAYQGAPTPSAALIATGSKVASFFILAKVMMIGFAGAEGSGGWRNFISGWMPVLALVALLSMVMGNLIAIVQNSVKRLLAYSAIAHGGYALLAVLANDGRGMASLIYYVVTYGVTVLGAFGVVSAVEDRSGEARLSDFAGLARRSPVLSFCMMIFMLSLAGIPPLAGFFGKFYVFAAAAGSGGGKLGLLWIVIVAIAMSAVSLYYYLQVLKQIYVKENPAGGAGAGVPVVTTITVVLMAILVVILGAAPQLVLGTITHAIEAVGM